MRQNQAGLPGHCAPEHTLCHADARSQQRGEGAEPAVTTPTVITQSCRKASTPKSFLEDVGARWYMLSTAFRGRDHAKYVPSMKYKTLGVSSGSAGHRAAGQGWVRRSGARKEEERGSRHRLESTLASRLAHTPLTITFCGYSQAFRAPCPPPSPRAFQSNTCPGPDTSLGPHIQGHPTLPQSGAGQGFPQNLHSCPKFAPSCALVSTVT
jgi:hypothetical protein